MSLTKARAQEAVPQVGVMELLQAPVHRRQTGALVVTGPDDEVRLYYAQGKLVHATSSARAGIDALAQVLGWPGGDAEFVSGAVCDQRTIDVDVPRATVLALKMLDSRARSATSPTSLEQQPARLSAITQPTLEKRAAVVGPRIGRAMKAEGENAAQLDVELCVRLERYVAVSGFARYACILRSDGELQAEGGLESGVEGVTALRAAMTLLSAGYSRPGLDRVVIEDRLGTIVLTNLADRRALMVVGERQPELAGVIDGISRLVASLVSGAQ